MSTDTSADQLIARWIESNPDRPDPAHAWVLPRHVSAWVVIGQLQLEDGNVETVADAYELPPQAVQAAMAFYRRHRTIIDERIAAHRAFFGE